MKIAIDGPAGAGKSTVARRVARELGILYIDTGAMYRALTWKALQLKINLSAPEELHQLAADTVIDIRDHGDGTRIYCDGREVTTEIRSPEVSRMVSVLAADDKVREVMVEKQRAIASRNDVVMDGRILPIACCRMRNTSSILLRPWTFAPEDAARNWKIKVMKSIWNN